MLTEIGVTVTSILGGLSSKWGSSFLEWLGKMSMQEFSVWFGCRKQNLYCLPVLDYPHPTSLPPFFIWPFCPTAFCHGWEGDIPITWVSSSYRQISMEWSFSNSILSTPPHQRIGMPSAPFGIMVLPFLIPISWAKISSSISLADSWGDQSLEDGAEICSSGMVEAGKLGLMTDSCLHLSGWRVPWAW